MSRAKAWSPEVENAFRLQEAGYRDEKELVAVGVSEPIERWPSGFIRKLPTKHSIVSGGRILLYFRQARECEAKHLNQVKLYRYA